MLSVDTLLMWKMISLSDSDFPKVTRLVVCSIRIRTWQFRLFFSNSHISIPHFLWSPSAQALHVRWAMTFFTKAAFSYLLTFCIYNIQSSEALDFFFQSAAHVPDCSNPPPLSYLPDNCLHHFIIHMQSLVVGSNAFAKYHQRTTILPSHNECLRVEFENIQFK